MPCRMLCDKGCSARRGTIVDATIVNALVQRNTRRENKQVKSGEIPEEWKEKQAKLSQKDVDAPKGAKMVRKDRK